MSNSLKRFSLSAGAAGVIVAALAFSGAAAAQAAPLIDTERAEALWYADRLKFDELEAQGLTGEGIKIAVIDNALNVDAPELQGANITVKGSYCAFPDTGEPVEATSTDVARAGHGTDVVSMLVGNGAASDGGAGTRGIVPDAEVMFYASGMPEEIYNPDGPQCENYDAEAGEFHADKGVEFEDEEGYFLGRSAAYAAWHAIDHGADVIVYSGISGDISGWRITLVKALREGVPLVAGTPNPDGVLSQQFYPYSLNGVVAVSGIDNEGNLLNGGGDATGDTFRGDAEGTSNLGFVSAGTAMLTPSNMNGWGPSIGNGTSLATPLVAGTIAIGLQNFPDATAHQVLQAMIRTTGSSGIHEPEWLGAQWGYGNANPSALLTTNPLDYPDVNPLFAVDMDDPRCVFADGGVVEGAVGMEGCAWASLPSGEDVWPTGDNGEPGEALPAPGDTPREQTVPTLVWIVGGAVLLGVIVTAIVIPVVIARDRKRRIQVPPHDFDESETYRG